MMKTIALEANSWGINTPATSIHIGMS
jgi:hypothetical protein